jgi:hypothetical protein
MSGLIKTNDLKQYSFSNTEIKRIIGYKMLSYLKLYNYDNFKLLLYIHNGSVIIMYHQTENYGHYGYLNKLTEKHDYHKKKNVNQRNRCGVIQELIEFFDSKSLFSDRQLKFTDYEMNAKLKQNHIYLSYLMYSSSYKLNFNEHHFLQLMSNASVGLQCFIC